MTILPFSSRAIATMMAVVSAGLSVFSTVPVMAVTEWPMKVPTGDQTVTMHQPQVDNWKDYRELSIRAVVGVGKGSETQDQLGVLQGTAQTVVDSSTRNVAMSNFTYTLRFPGTTPEKAAELEKAVRAVFPGTRTVNITLDQVVAYLNAGDADQQKEVAVNLNPPLIIYSNKPAILVQFLGEPSFTPVQASDPTLLHAVNTNWDVFLSSTDKKIYLLNDKSWLELTDRGIQKAKTLPPGLMKLPDDENWADVKKNIPGVEANTIPAVYRTTSPAELIITDGEPKMRAIPQTGLMHITNTASLLFFAGSDQRYYFLVAGRWFSAPQLQGPWQSATDSLPEDFKNIPPNDVVAEVLSSVKGAPQAQDAVMLASVPTMTKVSIATATLEVVYEGEPVFKTIPGTQVQCAINTPQDVFLVNGVYYCCSEGVWFTATDPKGPWTLCKEVDPAIYDIPPDHPKHNDTYVQVYDSDPDYVSYGYTGGYTGGYVSDGLLMFGAGAALYDWLDDEYDDNYDDYYDHYPVPLSYYSYGIGAHYNYGLGGYYGASRYYGPYGGAGRYAAYNPATGIYSRGAAVYGPRSNAGIRQGYNPWTDTYAARARVNTPNGSAGRFYAERDGDEIWGGSRSGSQGSIGWAQSSEGGKAAAWDTRYNEGAAIKNKQGDVMVGNDGNIYKRDDGDWQKYDDGGWNDVDRPDNPRPEPHNARNNNQLDNRVANNKGLDSASQRPGSVGQNGNAQRPGNVGQNGNAQRPGNVGQNGNAQRPGTGASGTRPGNTASNLPANSRPTGNRPTQGSPSKAVDLSGQNRASAGGTTPRSPTQSQRPATKPSTMDRSTYQNLEQQSAARARGTANSKQYQQTRAASSSRPSSSQRPSSSSRPSSAQRPSSSSRPPSSSQRSSNYSRPPSSSRPSSAQRQQPRPQSRPQSSSRSGRSGGGGGGGRGRR